MEYEACRRKYRLMDQELAQLYYRIKGPVRQQPRLFVPGDSALVQERRILDGLRQEAKHLPVPHPVFHVLQHHFTDFLDTIDYALKEAENSPQRKYTEFPDELLNESRISRQSDEAKLAYLQGCLRQLNDSMDVMEQLLEKRHDSRQRQNDAQNLLHACQQIREQDVKKLFPSFSQEMCNDLDAQLKDFAVALEAMSEKLDPHVHEKKTAASNGKENPARTFQMRPYDYRELLSKQYGVSLDTILIWHKAEIEKTRAEVMRIASALPIAEKPKDMQDVSKILFAYEPPCQCAEQMFLKERQYLQRTRTLAHEVVHLPEDERCDCVTIPETIKDSFPWGGYEGGDMDVLPFHGQMFLNQYNVKNISDGWLKLNALHEAYPGHHVQFTRAAVDIRPETVNIGSKVEPLLEGTCLRTERAFEWIYGEDPFFPLFVAYRRHHASVRILVDLMMFYYGASLQTVVDIYQRELGFDYVTARGQVQAQQNMPGYFTSYYYGMKQICSWEKEYGFSKKEYTELLMSAGFVSIDTFQEILKLNQEGRDMYFHDFGSLLK
ncbi:MAG: DUF885 family protein [Bulleidia sp.]|nr:DUF885 family protein [Bulleidia sp.]